MRITGQEQIAKAFGVAPKTIVAWQTDGFPVAVQGQRGIASEYDLPACIEWLVKREVTKVQGERPQDRLARAQAIRVEIDIAEAQKLLIPAADVEPKWRAACVAAREQLLRARRKLVDRLGRCKTVKERSEAVAEVHEQFLRTLANWRSASTDTGEAES